MKFLNLFMAMFLATVLLASCSSPEGKAKKELEAKGIEVTTDSLLAQVKNGNTSNIQLLLTAGVPVDSTGTDGSHALSLAASSGQTALIDVLLTAGADLNKKDKKGNTALMTAVDNGNTESALALISKGARTDLHNKKDKTVLEIALQKKNWSVVTALAKAGANFDKQDRDGRTRLLEALQSDEEDKELIKILIAAGADVNIADKYDQTPFTEAVNRKLFEIASLMVQKGADVNAVRFKNNTYSALMYAIEIGQMEFAKVLIETGADVNFAIHETNDSCLHKAVYNQQKDIVASLIKAGAAVNFKNNFYESPLSRATIAPKGKDLEIADMLLKAGADINALVSMDGRTSLHLAVLNSNSNLDSLNFLLDKGAKTDIYDNEGQTPLTLAITNNKTEAVEALIKAGADVNFPTLKGDKPLELAEKTESRKIVYMLKKAGATD